MANKKYIPYINPFKDADIEGRVGYYSDTDQKQYQACKKDEKPHPDRWQDRFISFAELLMSGGDVVWIRIRSHNSNPYVGMAKVGAK